MAKIEPLFTFTNEQGQIEGVKYDRINVALVNAVKELATENDTLKQQVQEQREQLRRQQQQIEAVTRLVCASNPTARTCKAARR